uniref:Uncharacterized protein n=1 Tax=Glossina austeni TaxID=7395 RepID=A0A1A9V4A4_GLOAU
MKASLVFRHLRLIEKMKFFAFLFTLLSVATADVSHILPSGYSSSHASASAPVASYSVPSSQSYAKQSDYSASTYAALPAYSPQTYSSYKSYSAPATQSHSASVHSTYSAPAYNSYSSHSGQTASFAAPSYGSYSNYVEPGHSYSSSDGYTYKIGEQHIHRRRRDVSHLLASSSYSPAQEQQLTLSQNYLPPKVHAGAEDTSALSYLAPTGNNYQTATVSSSAVSYSAPTIQLASYSIPNSYDSYSSPSTSYSNEYEINEPTPSHTFSATEGYRYKVGHRVARRSLIQRNPALMISLVDVFVELVWWMLLDMNRWVCWEECTNVEIFLALVKLM